LGSNRRTTKTTHKTTKLPTPTRKMMNEEETTKKIKFITFARKRMMNKINTKTSINMLTKQ
jgi:hypothetical protein